MDFKETLKSKTFVSWAPLLLYLTTKLKRYGDAYLFGNDQLRFNFGKYGEGFQILFIYLVYFGILYFITPHVESALQSKVEENKRVFFHGVLLTLVILIGSFILRKDYDLLLKLGILWSIILIQWFLSSSKDIKN